MFSVSSVAKNAYDTRPTATSQREASLCSLCPLWLKMPTARAQRVTSQREASLCSLCPLWLKMPTARAQRTLAQREASLCSLWPLWLKTATTRAQRDTLQREASLFLGASSVVKHLHGTLTKNGTVQLPSVPTCGMLSAMTTETHCPFSHLIGNDEAKSHIKHMVSSGSVANSLLFSGPAGTGKGQFALAFARMLMTQDDPNGTHAAKVDHGNHPDIRHFRPEGKIGFHSMDTLRELVSEVQQAPYEGRWRVFIIHDAERMLPYSANALLKGFEEPLQSSVIILVTSQPRFLLGTILSRCRQVVFRPIAEDVMLDHLVQKKGVEAGLAAKAAALSRGSLERAMRIADGDDGERARIIALLCRHRADYREITALVGVLSENVEANKQRLEEELRKQLQQVDAKDMTAIQRDALEKEIAGAVSTRQLDAVDMVLDTIVSWYRDLHLIAAGGDKALLFNRDQVGAIEQAVSRGGIPSMQVVEQAAVKARTAVQRSIPFKNAMEGLLVKLVG